jgi:hypothetical protein
MRLFAAKQPCREFNLRKLVDGVRDGGIPRGAFVSARHNAPAAKGAPEDKAGGLQAEGYYGVGGPQMLTTNLWTAAGLVNGLRGVLHDLVCTAPPPSPPRVALLRVEYVEDEQTGEMRSAVNIPCCLPAVSRGNFTIVPVPCVEREWTSDGKDLLSRFMLPLQLAWAITIHKAQGLTLPRVVLSVGPTERYLGIFFVAISRVRALDHLAFDRPFDMQRISRIVHSSALVVRKMVDRRLSRLEQLGTDPWLSGQLGPHVDGPVGALREWLREFCVAWELMQ